MTIRKRDIGFVFAAAGLLAASVWAQSNSLFGRSRGTSPRPGQVPTTQPAKGSSTAVLTSAAIGARAMLQAERPILKPNAVLLRASPIAVDIPQPEAIKVNDLITIIIRESKTATSDSKMESKKDWKLDAELSKWIKLSDKHGIVPAALAQGNPAIQFDYKDDYGGDGKYDRKDELTTRITGRVIDVKPNGNLVLEAQGTISIDDDSYTLTLTGVCRAVDVTPQNTVLSTQIAERVIDVQHTGAIRDATRRGWAKRLFDWLRPF